MLVDVQQRFLARGEFKRSAGAPHHRPALDIVVTLSPFPRHQHHFLEEDRAQVITEMGRGILPGRLEGVEYPRDYRISQQAVQKAFRRYCQRNPLPGLAEMRQIDTQRCDDIYRAMLPMIRKGGRGSALAADAATRALAHKAKKRTVTDEQGEGFVEFLKRVMLHAASLAAPKDVAWFMASYAREALRRVEKKSDVPALSAIRNALEEALAIEFEGKKGEHFFCSTLVQTLFYGVFSAWVFWTREHPLADRNARFDWRTGGIIYGFQCLRSCSIKPAIPLRSLASNCRRFSDWTGTVLNRIDRAAFFTAFEEHHAVQYFTNLFSKRMTRNSANSLVSGTLREKSLPTETRLGAQHARLEFLALIVSWPFWATAFSKSAI
jgi:hypothetical protein